jgi:tRNA nucleotidyltransferase (CCA-adding enzyme)
MDRGRSFRERIAAAVRDVRLTAAGMQVYVVGGAVRDELLGLPVVDRDWVVVGATPEEMVAQGFRPVGKDFPVFLHPETHEEYALARTERKSGRGYKGFTVYSAPDVTLEEDLARRDLTINAMARGPDGQLMDPFGGEKDLRAGVLRHVGEAFAEDPVRILRVARFAARFQFRVAEETMELMRRMVGAGEADFLVAERVWQEFARGLLEPHAQAMFVILEDCGALARLAPELNALIAGDTRDAVFGALDRAAHEAAPLPVRFALLAWFAGAGCEAAFSALGSRLRVPMEERELAILLCRCREGIAEAAHADAAEQLALLKRADGFRRKERFEELLLAARLAEPAVAAGAERARSALRAAAAIDAGAIAAGNATSPAAIAAAIDAARLEAVGKAMQS